LVSTAVKELTSFLYQVTSWVTLYCQGKSGQLHQNCFEIATEIPTTLGEFRKVPKYEPPSWTYKMYP